MLRRNMFWPLAALALLVGCGPLEPQYQTDYELIAPQSSTGKMCANNCLMAQTNCRQSCQLQEQSCQQMERLQDENDYLHERHEYEEYVRMRTRQGKPIKRSPPSRHMGFSGFSQCESLSCMNQCDQSFNICYGNCGGQVIPHKRCVANCNQPPAAGY
jgi:hypothetical protein